MNKKFLNLVVAVIITMLFTACEKENNKQIFVGKWAFVDRNGVTLEITKNEIMLLPVVVNPTPMETRTYHWVSSNTINITQQSFGGELITRNKVIFHTSDRVTIKEWFISNGPLDEEIYADVTIERISE